MKEAYSQTQNCQYHHGISSHPSHGSMRTNENAKYKWEEVCSLDSCRLFSVYMGEVFENQGRDSRGYHQTH